MDEHGNALRRPMNYLDQKGVREYRECMGRGIIKASGCSLYKLARKLFFNIRVDNDKGDLMRAVMKGVCYHLRWLLECVMRKVKTSHAIRFVGGGSLSAVICQALADITGRPIETIDNPQ